MMYEEAKKQIEYLEDEYMNSCGGYPYDEFEGQCIIAFDMSVEALEKQIPKKPNKAIDHTWGTEKEVPVCPVCDYYITPVQFVDMTICETTGKCEKPKVTYCEVCGQAILWEGEVNE